MNKTNLIFLHGGPGYPDYLAEFFDGHFPKNFGLTFYDQARGPHVDILTLTEQLHEFVLSKENSVYLIGHSWGGALALEYVRKNESLVKGIILMDACVLKAHCFEEFETEMRIRNIKSDDIESIFFTNAEKPSGRKLLTHIDPLFDQNLFEKFEKDYLSTLDLRDILASTQLPILNLYGSEDVRIPASALSKLGELNPRISSMPILGAGHFPFLLSENRTLIVKAVVSFVGIHL